MLEDAQRVQNVAKVWVVNLGKKEGTPYFSPRESLDKRHKQNKQLLKHSLKTKTAPKPKVAIFYGLSPLISAHRFPSPALARA